MHAVHVHWTSFLGDEDLNYCRETFTNDVYIKRFTLWVVWRQSWSSKYTVCLFGELRNFIPHLWYDIVCPAKHCPSHNVNTVYKGILCGNVSYGKPMYPDLNPKSYLEGQGDFHDLVFVRLYMLWCSKFKLRANFPYQKVMSHDLNPGSYVHQ